MTDDGKGNKKSNTIIYVLTMQNSYLNRGIKGDYGGWYISMIKFLRCGEILQSLNTVDNTIRSFRTLRQIL